MINKQEIDKPEFYIIYQRNSDEDIDYFLQKQDPVIVVGGVSGGSSIAGYLKKYQNPFIYGFESNPEIIGALKTKFRSNKNVDIRFNAVGGEDKNISFNIFDHAPSSSALNSTEIGKKYYGKRYEIKQRVEVAQVRMDSVLDGKDIDILKLDLQGYELEALRGCKNILNKIKIITLEIAFIEAYEGQALFGDIDLFLKENNFGLFNFSSLWHAKGGQLISGDALYLNKNFFEGVKC